MIQSQNKKIPAAARQKKKQAGKLFWQRFLLCFATVLVCLLVGVYVFLFSVLNGPSPSFRDQLVLSALEGSATKWLPNLFLPQSLIDEISAESRAISTDQLSLDDYLTQDVEQSEDEWEGYADGIRIETVKRSTFTAYVMLVRDPSTVYVGPTYSYASATAGKQIFRAVEMEGAIAAINGGEFSDAGGGGSGAQPMGLTYSKGECVWNDGHYSTFMGFDRNNRLIVKNGVTKEEADALGVRDGVSFWGQEGENILISNEDGKISFHYATGDTAVAQRTAIGQRADGTVVMIVTDGRSASSLGATRNDLVDLFREYGAVAAGRLDGGSSTMMYYEDYAEKYGLDPQTLNENQKLGMVNNFKAFTGVRYIPTYFMVRAGV